MNDLAQPIEPGSSIRKQELLTDYAEGKISRAELWNKMAKLDRPPRYTSLPKFLAYAAFGVLVAALVPSGGQGRRA